jgi:oligopeptide/dipeptide ABC transporter ATP-binding protein
LIDLPMPRTDHAATDTSLLDITGLKVRFDSRDGTELTAVDGISIRITENQVHGLIGESGSGKTVTALACMGLLDANARIAGTVNWRGKPMLGAREREWQRVRGRGMAMMFQNSVGSLNPALRIGRQLIRVFRLHHDVDEATANGRVIELLGAVQLADPERVMRLYVHECSGGMAQRICLAMTLACSPDLLIADEPTSSVDVTVASQLIDLLRRTVRERRFSMLVITHDLGVARRLCDIVSVMYNGRIVEQAPALSVLTDPQHPYSKMLREAATWNRDSNDLPEIRTIVEKARPMNLDGCRFQQRCPEAIDKCITSEPPLENCVQSGHKCACWLAIPSDTCNVSPVR